MAFALLDDTIDEILTGTFKEKDRQINFAIEELEDIKAEIMSIGNWREHYEMPIAYLSCLTIVENHISELKSEKEDFDHEGFYNFLLNTIQPNEMEKYRSMFLSSGEIVN